MPRIDRKEVADRIYARANYCEDMAGVITTFHDREEQYEEGDRAAALRGLAIAAQFWAKAAPDEGMDEEAIFAAERRDARGLLNTIRMVDPSFYMELADFLGL